jgi:hypothetical protein
MFRSLIKNYFQNLIKNIVNIEISNLLPSGKYVTYNGKYVTYNGKYIVKNL